MPIKKVVAQDWVDAVLAGLNEGLSPGDTSIADLAARISAVKGDTVTKGAFYPHFANAAALYEAVIAEWLRDRMEAMPHTAISEDGAVRDPLDRIRRIRSALTEHDLRDGAMRRWAATDPDARKAVALADRILVSHLEHALADLGFPAREAAAQARFVAAALRTSSSAPDEESFGVILGGLAAAAEFSVRSPEVRRSEDPAGKVVLYTGPGGLRPEDLRVLQRITDLLSAQNGSNSDPPGDQEPEHAGTA